MPDLARLAGSVFCVGLPGATLSADDRNALQDLAPGGIVLFAHNVSTLEGTRKLLADARETIGGEAPALGCVDQEGGSVVRLKFSNEAMPSMLALGATGDESLAERAGRRLAAELRAIGANLNFAPVLDLALESRNTVIGTRSLGNDPERVARLGAALVRGMQRSGVAATVKHFPGHGATAVDSHVALPAVEADAATLCARELVPFAGAFAAGARAVMSAHVVVPALDAARPATLSPRILTELLRGKMRFGGVCFTDCLRMEAIAGSVGTPRAAALALAAGADAALVSHDLALARVARNAIVAAVEDGDLPLWRLEEAAERVVRLRLWATGATPAQTSEDGVARAIARAALRIERGDPNIDSARPVTVISFEGNIASGVAAVDAQRPSLSLALRRRHVRSELMRVELEPDSSTLQTLLDVVGAQGQRQFVLLARRAHLHPAQREALGALLAHAPDAIAISALEPFDLPALDGARTVIASFGDETANVEALADLLTAKTVPD